MTDGAIQLFTAIIWFLANIAFVITILASFQVGRWYERHYGRKENE